MSILKKLANRFLSFERRRFLKNIFLRKPLPYDCVLHICPNEHTCNLKCEYCTFLDKHPNTPVSVVDTKGILDTLDRTGLAFKVAIAGNGEPFLVPNLVDFCEQVAKKHYISLITNLTSPKVLDFCEKIDPKKVISITASTHIKELERLGLMDRFLKNFLALKKKGFNVVAEEVAYPPLLPEIGRYKDFFRGKGISLKFGGFIGVYDGKEYPASYTKKERFVLGINKVDEVNCRRQKGELCHAGYNMCFLQEGNIYPCFEIKEKIGNVNERRLLFKNKMIRCPFDCCTCGLKFLEYDLFEKAVAESRKKSLVSSKKE